MRKPHRFILSLFLISAFYYSDGQTTTASFVAKANNSTKFETTQERNKQTVLASYKAYESGDLDAFFKDWDKDAKVYRISAPDAPISLDSIVLDEKKNYPQFIAAFPDFKQKILASVSEGDYVITWLEYSGTSKADFKGMKATGKSFKYNDADIFKFNKTGKIIEYHHVQSIREVGIQVGHLVVKRPE